LWHWGIVHNGGWKKLYMLLSKWSLMYMIEKILLKYYVLIHLYSPNYLHTYKLTLVSPVKEFYINTIWVKFCVVQFWNLAKNLSSFAKTSPSFSNASMSIMASTCSTYVANISSLSLTSLALSLATPMLACPWTPHLCLSQASSPQF